MNEWKDRQPDRDKAGAAGTFTGTCNFCQIPGHKESESNKKKAHLRQQEGEPLRRIRRAASNQQFGTSS